MTYMPSVRVLISPHSVKDNSRWTSYTIGGPTGIRPATPPIVTTSTSDTCHKRHSFYRYLAIGKPDEQEAKPQPGAYYRFDEQARAPNLQALGLVDDLPKVQCRSMGPYMTLMGTLIEPRLENDWSHIGPAPGRYGCARLPYQPV
jgi:hypothetical protein